MTSIRSYILLLMTRIHVQGAGNFLPIHFLGLNTSLASSTPCSCPPLFFRMDVPQIYIKEARPVDSSVIPLLISTCFSDCFPLFVCLYLFICSLSLFLSYLYTQTRIHTIKKNIYLQSFQGRESPECVTRQFLHQIVFQKPTKKNKTLLKEAQDSKGKILHRLSLILQTFYQQFIRSYL